MFRDEEIGLDLIEIPRLPTGLRECTLILDAHYGWFIVVYNIGAGNGVDIIRCIEASQVDRIPR